MCAGEKIIDNRTGILAIGFGTTVCMWAVGYVCRVPPVAVPSWLLLILLAACMAGGGFVAGRRIPVGLMAGAMAGFLTAVLNMAVLGGLLGGGRPNRVDPSAAWWIPGFLLLGTVLGAVGGAVGARGYSFYQERPLNWTAAFARVACAATLLLLAVGGLVTSKEAGLAVADWPNSFGYNMFLYPLSRMTGGIYYEHAHRLFGSLVGLTTLVLAVHLFRADEHRWLRLLAAAAVLLVCVQGALGGLRVTGKLTFSASAADMAPSAALAVVHGVIGQLFFALLVAIAVFTSTAWRSGGEAKKAPAASTERGLSVLLVGLLLLQLSLGAALRHLGAGLIIHISAAAVVTALAFGCGARAWGLYEEVPALRLTGILLMVATGIQLILGISAFVAIGALAGRGPSAADVILATAHQTAGAILLGCATALALWNFRFLSPETPPRGVL